MEFTEEEGGTPKEGRDCAVRQAIRRPSALFRGSVVTARGRVERRLVRCRLPLHVEGGLGLSQRGPTRTDGAVRDQGRLTETGMSIFVCFIMVQDALGVVRGDVGARAFGCRVVICAQ